jgi:hypothetical protein
MVRSQINNLTFGPSFGHNLCFKYPNGSCELISNIYILIDFHKELFNPMSFDPYKRSLEIQKSIETSIPKVGVHLWVCGFIPSHSFTLLRAWNVIRRLHFWHATLQALALVASPRLGLWHRPSILTIMKFKAHVELKEMKEGGIDHHYQ